MAVVYLALGSNLGERAANLWEALRRLAPPVTVQRLSSIYETEPWGLTEQPRFLNAVVCGQTGLDPMDLLRHCNSIEREMGRLPTVRYGPRLIDLDILFYDKLVLKSSELEIPHPRLAERRFVLVPLSEIGSDVRHPVLGPAVGDLLARLPDDGSVSLYRTADQ